MTTEQATTAADLMHTEVITLQVDASIEEAVQTFEEFHIQGAPVLDQAGKLVGVLTSADIARTGHVRGNRIEARRGDSYFADTDSEGEDDEDFADKDEFSDEALGSDRVGDWMTPRVVSVRPTTTLKEMCGVMIAESIHRVLVVERNQLRGIVTALDVVRHVAERG
ncbi:MAG: CBS domain-containing protein [Planctomycetes bacterium]|nr:CBS domain-containing protein [Planctomycetota bacterium]